MRMTNPYDEILAANTMPGSERRTLVIAATFGEREIAHDAAYRLRAEGFHQTWIGIARRNVGNLRLDTNVAETAVGENDVDAEMHVESDNWLTRMFGDREETLRDALIRHGVAAADAASGVVPDGSAVLTVEAEDDPQLAERMILDFGGRLITSVVRPDVQSQHDAQVVDSQHDALVADTQHGAQSDDLEERQPATPRMTSLLEDGTAMTSGYDEFGGPHSAAMVDESTRLQLDQERTRVDRISLAPQESTTVVVTAKHNDYV